MTREEAIDFFANEIFYTEKDSVYMEINSNYIEACEWALESLQTYKKTNRQRLEEMDIESVLNEIVEKGGIDNYIFDDYCENYCLKNCEDKCNHSNEYIISKWLESEVKNANSNT